MSGPLDDRGRLRQGMRSEVRCPKCGWTCVYSSEKCLNPECDLRDQNMIDYLDALRRSGHKPLVSSALERWGWGALIFWVVAGYFIYQLFFRG